jgi:hypothetical protein
MKRTLLLSCPPPQGASPDSFKEQRMRTVKHENPVRLQSHCTLFQKDALLRGRARASNALPPALPYEDHANMAYVTFLYGNNETEFPKRLHVVQRG